MLKLQTRYDCLQTHRQISLLVQELRALVNADDKETVATVKQLEVLGKRIIDGHYEYAKKMTLTEAISNDVATATSIIGWTTGFPAAILGVAGIFFPPLLVPAGILGSISFISYTASIISVANMANQAFTYGRSPHPRDFWWMVFDIVLAPINLAGGAIFSAFANLAKPVKHLPNIINAVGNWWNNVFSNLLPDVFVVKDNIDDSKKMGSAYTARGRLRNSPTASSWSKMGSALSQTDNDASSILRKTKEEIALAKEGSKRRPDIDASYQSKEASLKLLNEQISKRDELKNIHQAVNDYFGLNDKLPLPHQFTNQDEYRAEIYRKSLALVNIMDACEKFTKDNKELAEPLALVAEITQTAKNIEQHLSESYEKLNTAKAIENTSAHGRDFAFVKVSSHSESLIFSKSHQAAILLWGRGFIGARTSSEASAVIKAVKAYRELDPDAPSNVRLSALDIIAKNCQAYIDLNQGDSKKGRLQYVEKLAEAVKKKKPPWKSSLGRRIFQF